MSSIWQNIGAAMLHSSSFCDVTCMSARLVSTVARRLRHAYDTAKATMEVPQGTHVNPRGVFCNSTLHLRDIAVYGFDYDYTLAVYTTAVNKLLYDLAIDRLIKHFKVCSCYHPVIVRKFVRSLKSRKLIMSYL